MSLEKSPTTVKITIDLKKDRIRIHRALYDNLGSPKYMQLLVNPIQKHVAVKAVTSSIPGDQTEKFKPKQLMKDRSYELCSRYFIQKLCNLADEIEPNCTYHLSGKIIPQYNMAIFPLNTLKRTKE